MIKVNQITAIAQAERLKKRIDIGGICISRQVAPQPPYLSFETALALRQALPGLSLSVSFCRDDGFETAEMLEILTAVKADFFEFTPIDFAKTELFEAQLEKLGQLNFRKIANGFFILTDDFGFIRETNPYQKMRQIGVELFQFEIESAVDPIDKIEAAKLVEVESFFNQLPVLVTDKITRVQDYPIQSVKGFFFNILPAKRQMNYDYSTLNWRESEITRVLMR